MLQLVLPRRYAFVPVVVAGCYMPLGQALIVAGLHFYLLRVLILFGVARILVRKELTNLSLNGIDCVLVAGIAVNTFLYVLFDGSNTTLTMRLGAAYDAVGTYILVRATIKSLDDAVAVVKACAVITIPLAVPFIMESISGRNVFAVLGAEPLSEIRNGHVRCSGPFRHSILAGTFGATAVPLFVGLWVSDKKSRLAATLAIVSATIIVVTSRSSGPMTALLVASISLLIWPCRRQMRAIRWGLLLAVIGLAAVMKAPVWFLISRISDWTGGSGWYRSALIDAAITHFDEWWRFGTGYTAHWMATGANWDSNSADLVNEFVFQGVNGGLLAVILFIWLIVKCFKSVGTAIRTSNLSAGAQFMVWSMGCGFVAHVASFFSVSYFDQIIIFWYLVIGMIVATGRRATVMVSSPEPVAARGAGAQPKFGHLRLESRYPGLVHGRRVSVRDDHPHRI